MFNVELRSCGAQQYPSLHLNRQVKLVAPDNPPQYHHHRAINLMILALCCGDWRPPARHTPRETERERAVAAQNMCSYQDNVTVQWSNA